MLLDAAGPGVFILATNFATTLIHRAIKALLCLAWFGSAEMAFGASGPSSSSDSLRQVTRDAVRSQVAALLEKHCRDACSILDVRVEADDDEVVSDDLGFEGVANSEPGARSSISKIALVIQVDDRVSSLSRDRLQVILQNAIQSYGGTVEVSWRAITLPQIGQTGAKEEEIKRGLEERVTAALERVIETYCPEQCVLSSVSADGRLVTIDEASLLKPEQIVRDRSGQVNLKVEAVDAEVSMDSDLSPENRTKIANIMRAKTRFVSPVHIEVNAVAFPESFNAQREREKEQAQARAKDRDEDLAREREMLATEAKDPYGLEKLRQTLMMFRELASTKEIVTSTTLTSQNSTVDKSSSASKEVSASSSSSKESESKKTEAESKSTLGEGGWEKFAIIGGGLLLLAGLVFALVMRLAGASRDARLMMEAVTTSRRGSAPFGASEGFGQTEANQAPSAAEPRGLTAEQRRDLVLRMRNDELREELIKIFFESPRVAKETFSRLLQEQGVEETARYVHIFGHVVVFELLGDPNLQRDLNDLSEFFHNAAFSFTPEEENKLLLSLKTRVTANEIRVLSRKQMDKFDFLSKLDANQIYSLIADEKAQVQSIVLTQLDHKRRRAVFDLYEGQLKLDLMRELCRAEALPKEYLSNVARSLSKKISGRPEFDTQNLRASEILLELLEKAPLDEQKNLMQNLVDSNPEGARGIKLRLVTIEIMPYLKDGHLLEIVLGMERSDLISFLAGTREHIRALILSKAPEELAESWIEELSNVRRVDEQNYRLVEMKVLNRIRYLASEGLINVLDINELIFARSSGTSKDQIGEGTGIDPGSAMVA
jgi:flagellar motor switch protein FliG